MRSITIALIFHSSVLLSQANLDSLLDQSLNLINDNKSNPAIETLQLILESKTKDQMLLAKTNINLGLCYYNLGDYKLAEDYYNKSIGHARDTGDSLIVATIYKNLGLLHLRRGNYSLAEKFNLSAIEIFESSNSPQGIADINNSLGLLFNEIGEYEKAVIHLRKSYLIWTTLNNYQTIPIVTNNIGNSFFGINQYDSALLYYRTSIKIAEANHWNYTLPINNIGEVFLAWDQYDSAVSYLRQAFILRRENRDLRGMAYTANMLGEVYCKSNKYELALAYLDSAKTLAQKINAQSIFMKNLDLRIEIFKALGSYKKALLASEEYNFFKDSIFNEEKVETLALQSRYELNQKEKEGQLSRQQAELAISNNQRQTLISWTIGGVALIFLVTAILIYITRERIVRQNKIIENQKNDIIHLTKNSLNAALQLLREIGIDLEDSNLLQPVENTLIAFSSLQNFLYEKKGGKSIPMDRSLREWKTYFLRTIDGDFNKVDIQLKIESLELNFQEASLLTLIVNELAMNAKKHAFDKTDRPEITIELKKEGQHVTLIFSDNGHGFSQKIEPRRESGRGWKIIERFVAGLKGNLKVRNQNGALITISWSQSTI